MDLHEPIEPPEPYFSLFEAPGFGPRLPEDGKWAHMKETNLQDPAFLRYRAHHIAVYDGALRYVDSQVERLLARLRQLGLERDTLVVVTSDHGEEFWDHAILERTLAEDPRGFWGIGHGHTMFQELLHIPLIFRGPGVRAGTAIDCPVGQIDVAPTALELLGLPPEAGMRGRSLAPLLWGSSTDACDERVQIAESPAYGPDSTAVSWKGEKLILRHAAKPFLYDLRRDPRERDDLSERRPQAVAGLRHMLEAERPEGGVIPSSGEIIPLDEDKAAELRALGYLD
jgi:arylsulfatase A-like enzyme